jgi:hypothetical protein
MPVLVQPATVPPAQKSTSSGWATTTSARSTSVSARTTITPVSWPHSSKRVRRTQRYCRCQLPGMTASWEGGQQRRKRPTAGSTATCRPQSDRTFVADRGRSRHPPPTLARPNAVLAKPTRRLQPQTPGADPPHGGSDLPRIDSPNLMDLARSRATRSCWLRRWSSLGLSLLSQGRPCGRPPAAAVLGRQGHHQRT